MKMICKKEGRREERFCAPEECFSRSYNMLIVSTLVDAYILGFFGSPIYWLNRRLLALKVAIKSLLRRVKVRGFAMPE